MTLVIDLDGVVRRWDPAQLERIEKQHSLPSGAVAKAAFGHSTSLRRAVTGEITDAEWRADIAARLGEQHGEDASAAVAAWSLPCGEVDHEVLDILRTARTSVKVGLLTNATTRLRADLAKLDLEREFDGIFSSAELGVAKPDPEVFLAACHGLGARPDACVFVDDSAENVAGAEQVGLRGHVFRDPAQLRTFLAAI